MMTTRRSRGYADLFIAFLYRDEPWMDQAACKDLDTSIFFPKDKHKYTEAREICRQCTVRADCLAYARRTGERQAGMFGGLSPEERHLRKAGKGLYVFEDFNGPCRRCRQWTWCPNPGQHLCANCKRKEPS